MFQREKASIMGMTGMHFRFMGRKLNKVSHAVKRNHSEKDAVACWIGYNFGCDF